jgi:hypothetical protein
VQLEDGLMRFAAFVEKDQGPFYGGVEGVDVRFSVDGREVATATSDERGVAMVRAAVATGAESFEATAHFSGRDFKRSGTVVQWRSDRVLVACDIDSTISDTSLMALFFDPNDKKSMPIGNSPDVLREIAERHDLIYFTARPKFTLGKTVKWLAANGFPHAPVLTSLSVGDMMRQGRYKRRELGKLRRSFPNLLIGIGNSDADAEGYGANAMLTLMVNFKGDMKYRKGDKEQGRHTIDFSDWEQIRAFFRVNRDLLTDPERLSKAASSAETVVVPLLVWDPDEHHNALGP